MAHRRKRVGEMDTTTLILLGVGGVAVIFLLMQANKPPTPTQIVTVPGQTPATAAQNDIAAAAALAPTLTALIQGDTEED